MYVLGIDGGGTRTTGIVADNYGNVYMKAVTGRSNPNTLSEDEFEHVITGLLLDLKNQDAKIFDQITVCFAGMAGVGETGRDAEVVRLLRVSLPNDAKVFVQNDAFNALYAGTLGETGVVQIAGTGAITFGINEEHKRVRSGGWGYLFNDEGSGFYLGNEALRAVFKEFDHLGPSTSLTSAILTHFHIKKIPDIIPNVYGEEHPRTIISQLARFVVEAAVADDEVAKNIISTACEEMIVSIQSCHSQLFDENHQTTIVLSGGVFTNLELFLQHFNELASEILPNVTFQPTLVPPIGGAIVAGLKSQGVVIDEHFVYRFNKQIEE